MFKYLRYGLTPILMTCVTAGILLGGAWMWLGLAAIVFCLVGGDALSKDDLSQPSYGWKWALNANLYLTLPVLLVMLFALAWMGGEGNRDFLGFGAWFSSFTGRDLFAARSATPWFHYVGAVFGCGFAVAGYGVNVAHELTHRTTDPVAMTAGRWLLAMGCMTDFSIEHVYGHHLYVGTARDPATALRGENVYRFILRSTIGGHRSAWQLEANRLRKRKTAVLSPQNRMLRGYAMSLILIGGSFAAGGVGGALLFVLQAAWAKAVLEIVNYMEHYGLVRAEGQPVLPRHSWNTNKWMSSVVLYSLTRHSAHHEKGDLPFWNLKPYPDAPEMPYGYLTTIFIALVPPLWMRVMKPRLEDWDARFATKEERRIAQTLMSVGV